MFLENRFERAIDRIRADGALPLRLELWNGRRIDFSPAPVVTVVPTLDMDQSAGVARDYDFTTNTSRTAGEHRPCAE
jgi:hypothetical protein